MLEIPESHTVARQMKDLLVGKEVGRVVAGASPHGFAFFSGDPEQYGEMLAGRVVDDAYPVAGQVELKLGEMRLLLGEGVNIRFLSPEDEPPKKHQLLLEFTDGSAIVCTIQMYGGMWAFREGTNDNSYYRVAQEKPSPLSEHFSREYFHGIWEGADPKLSVKALLATEQRIPGLGNGTLQDILFRARVNPQSRLRALRPEHEDILYADLRETLALMTKQGGRDTEKDLFGNPGGYKTILSAKTKDDPCPVCGEAIVRKAYMGGNVYFCPQCQPVLK